MFTLPAVKAEPDYPMCTCTGGPTTLEVPPHWRSHHIGGPTTLEAPPHWRPHHWANVTIVIELKCIETTTTKKVVSFCIKKDVEAPTKQCTLFRDRLIRPCLKGVSDGPCTSLVITMENMTVNNSHLFVCVSWRLAV